MRKLRGKKRKNYDALWRYANSLSIFLVSQPAYWHFSSSEKSISSASNTSLVPFIGYGGLPKFCHPLHPSQCSTKPEIRVESFSHFLAESFSHFLVESFSHFSRPGETLTRVTGVTKFWQSSVRVFVLNPSKEEEIRRFSPNISQFNFESFFSPSSGFVFETVQ